MCTAPHKVERSEGNLSFLLEFLAQFCERIPNDQEHEDTTNSRMSMHTIEMIETRPFVFLIIFTVSTGHSFV